MHSCAAITFNRFSSKTEVKLIRFCPEYVVYILSIEQINNDINHNKLTLLKSSLDNQGALFNQASKIFSKFCRNTTANKPPKTVLANITHLKCCTCQIPPNKAKTISPALALPKNSQAISLAVGDLFLVEHYIGRI